MTKQERQLRKTAVFPIMYGACSGASHYETAVWRSICAAFINGQRNDYPATLQALRQELSRVPR